MSADNGKVLEIEFPGARSFVVGSAVNVQFMVKAVGNYASYRAFDPWFIDAALGYGRLDYDNRRFVSDDATTVAGDRQGTYWFGSAQQRL